jgi:hypothetical protein
MQNKNVKYFGTMKCKMLNLVCLVPSKMPNFSLVLVAVGSGSQALLGFF